MGSTLGIGKIQEDWEHRFPVVGWPGFGLLVDGLGHLAIGFAVGAAPGALGGPTALCGLLAFVALGMREAWQYCSDDDPHLNLLDRLKDCAEGAVGGLIAGVVLC
jgi:hypothetical protein